MGVFLFIVLQERLKGLSAVTEYSPYPSSSLLMVFRRTVLALFHSSSSRCIGISLPASSFQVSSFLAKPTLDIFVPTVPQRMALPAASVALCRATFLLSGVSADRVHPSLSHVFCSLHPPHGQLEDEAVAEISACWSPCSGHQSVNHFKHFIPRQVSLLIAAL